MKAITLWQPWASLIAIGAKLHETRSWSTNYRGPIAIHAAAKRVGVNDYFGGGFESEVSNHLRHLFYRFDMSPRDEFRWIVDNLDYGAIIATATLTECWKVKAHTPTAIILKQSNGVGEDKIPIDAPYLLFGDYSVGRYVWGLAEINALPRPIPAKGGQRIWNWEGLCSDEIFEEDKNA